MRIVRITATQSGPNAWFDNNNSFFSRSHINSIVTIEWTSFFLLLCLGCLMLTIMDVNAKPLRKLRQDKKNPNIQSCSFQSIGLFCDGFMEKSSAKFYQSRQPIEITICLCSYWLFSLISVQRKWQRRDKSFPLKGNLYFYISAFYNPNISIRF